jgi:carbonic anhydrase/acetyltransferase-like protein (isoleucine patch superfamily)
LSSTYFTAEPELEKHITHKSYPRTGERIGKKDDEIVELRNQIANFSAQYNRLLERLKEVNAINKQWEVQYNEVKITAEATIQEKEHERIRLMDELSRSTSRLKFIENEMELAKEKIEENEKEMQNQKKIFAIVATDEDIVIPKKSEVGGRLKTNMNVKLGDGIVVHGDVEGNNVIIGQSCIIIGVIITKGSLAINKKTEVASDIAVGGDVVMESECKVRKIIAGGKVTIGEKCRIDRISSTGSVELKQGVVVKEGIEYVGSLSIGEHVSIGGNIKRKQTGGQPAPDVRSRQADDSEEQEAEPSDEEPTKGSEEDEEDEEGEAEEEEEEESAEEKPAPPQKPKKSCSKCGAFIVEGESFCPNCGKPVSDSQRERPQPAAAHPPSVQSRPVKRR